jgi:hypothetical protein
MVRKPYRRLDDLSRVCCLNFREHALFTSCCAPSAFARTHREIFCDQISAFSFLDSASFSSLLLGKYFATFLLSAFRFLFPFSSLLLGKYFATIATPSGDEDTRRGVACDHGRSSSDPRTLFNIRVFSHPSFRLRHLQDSLHRKMAFGSHHQSKSIRSTSFSSLLIGKDAVEFGLHQNNAGLRVKCGLPASL